MEEVVVVEVEEGEVVEVASGVEERRREAGRCVGWMAEEEGV